MKFGTGALPDTQDPRDKRFLAGSLVGSGPNRSYALGLLDHVYTDPKLGWLNQTTTSSCVGYGICQTLYTYAHSLGYGLPMGSPLATYFHACARVWGWQNVFDIGCQPRNAWESLREFGLVPIDKWPNRAKVNSWQDVADLVAIQPDPDCYRESIDHDWLRYYWVLSFGAEREYELRRLLDSGFPVALTLSVDSSFQDWQLRHGAWVRKHPIRGYHYVSAVGYESAGVWIANSYGIGFGQLGFALISWETVRSPETRSIVVPDFNLQP